MRHNDPVELSPEQRAAVTRTNQDACCVAGPGSGKTAVLVERYAWLIEQGVDAASILAITFTDKAATNIKTRLVKHFAADSAKRRAVEKSPVSTIHSFCQSLLRAHSIRAGLDPRFTLLDAREAKALQSATMETVLDRFALARRTEFVACAEAWAAYDFSKSLLSVHESLRMGGGARVALQDLKPFDPESALAALASDARQMLGDSPPGTTEPQRRRLANGFAWIASRAELPPLEWLDAFSMDKRGLKPGHPIHDSLDRIRALILAARSEVVASLFLPQRQLIRELLIAFDDEYSAVKHASARFDFNDLLEQALALLEREHDIRQETQDRFQAILMDELQDTNPIEWRVLDLIRSPGRFFAVGDINQSIYGFRHAVPGQFLQFQHSVAAAGGVIDRLERNYRSRVQILDTVIAATVATPCPGVTQHQLIAGRPYPDDPGPFVELHRYQSADGDEDGLEALWIARRLRELHDTLLIGAPRRKVKFSDMAILCRSKTHFEEFEAALLRFGIPCSIERGRNFYEEIEIVDLTNWLRVLENPTLEIPLFALLRSPFFGISDQQLAELRLRGGLAPEPAMQSIQQARALLAGLPADRVLSLQLDQSGYLESLAAPARANVTKFLQILRRLDANHPGDLTAHLQFIDDLRATGDEPNAPDVDAADAVRVLTIHSAKGLEFPVVAVASLHRKPSGPPEPICWSKTTGLGLKWYSPGTADSVADPVMTAFESLQSERESAEEDRLLYVAMTRAEERLILSWSDNGKPLKYWAAHIERALTPQFDIATHTGPPELLPPPELAARPPELFELIPVAEVGQASAAVAVTAVSLWADCPRRYLLETMLRWPTPPVDSGAQGSAMALGAEVHELLGHMRAEASPEAHALAQVFLDSPFGHRAAAAHSAQREFDFLVSLDGTLLRGQIDLWWDEPGGAVLLDYKTDRFLTPERTASYELQLRLYALALEKLSGRAPKEAWLFPLRTAEPHRVDLSVPVLDTLRQFQQAEAAGEFPTRQAERCRYCPYVAAACPVIAPMAEPNIDPEPELPDPWF
jgi:ATP-dependent exoDNAse (exonuclease V) beta subunit